MESANSMWERKKVEVRRLETEIETQLIQLENVECLTEDEHVQGLHNEAGRLVGVLKGNARVLGEWADEAVGREATMLRQQAERCEEVANEKSRALAQIMQSINAKRARHNLMADVQHEIQEYNESHSTRLLHEEQDSIQKSMAATRRLQDQAASSHQQIKDQFTIIRNASDRVARIAGMVPGIDAILGKIRNKKHRDVIVLSTLIAFCLFLIYVFW
eukprot:TRINITY_DN22277_c0_g1_i1.p1 TRINITY_DN22277_c0_g1~~TRINITY_DN22277_c0_g1_i1.p1  ORF type:complete len:217 (+),score=25.93 TRINITY_DN22277_c0_g1_i1:99-749(+)